MEAPRQEQLALVSTIYARTTRDLIVALARNGNLPRELARDLLDQADQLLALSLLTGSTVEAAREGLRDAIAQLPPS